MEQKQLDELEESFGEEFIEDEPLNSEQLSSEIDWLEPELDSKSKKMKKAKKVLSKKSTEKNTAKKVEEKKKSKEADEFYFPKKKEFNFSAKEEKATEKLNEKPKEEEFIEIKSAKESVPLETSAPIDPWAEEGGESSGLFKEASTWKAITGIAVILLIFSIFTQGFDFSEKATLTGATVLSLSDAEEEVLNYVNTQLLQKPFQAEVVSSTELDNLYLFTLSVAGQTVDSYLTKDGKLFFPQGFEMGKPLDSLGDVSSGEITEPVSGESDSSDSNLQEETLPGEVEVVEESVSEVSQPEAAVEEVTDIILVTLNAKKWVFTPNKIQAEKGDVVSLTIVPADLDFTFSIPELGIEQEVAGITKIKEFTVGKTGSFEFNCASCEAWRGMTGTLVVK